MRKEILFAVLAGALFGLVIAFGVWKANSTMSQNYPNQTESQETAKPQTPQSLQITLSEPESYDVVASDAVVVKGITQPNAAISFSAEDSDYVAYANKSGAFEQEIKLTSGVNEIVITAFDSAGNNVGTKLTLVYSSEFAKNQ